MTQRVELEKVHDCTTADPRPFQFGITTEALILNLSEFKFLAEKFCVSCLIL